MEQLLQEFYTTSSNERKAQIGVQLDQFRTSPQSWKEALNYINNNKLLSSPFVLFFMLSVLEDWVKHLLGQLSAKDKSDIKNFILQFLNDYKVLPSFITMKAIQVYVTIGKMDWPHQYPEFINEIQHTISDSQRCLLGVQMLKMVSEEFLSTKEDVTYSRKVELKSLLINKVPSLLNQLTDIMNNTYQQKRGGGSNSEVDTLCGAVLGVILHMFSWIPLNQILTQPLMRALFLHVQLAQQTSVFAFDCLNEIMERHFIPKEFEEYVLSIFSEVFSLLQRLTEVDVKSVDESFIVRFIHFTHLFVSHHLSRVEGSSKFPVTSFLELLFKFTFKQPSLAGYVECLEICKVFLNYLESANNPQITERYGVAFVFLLQELFKRIYWKHNQNQLKELDDQGDLESFVKSNLKLIGCIVEIYPNTTLAPMVTTLVVSLDDFQMIIQGTAAKDVLSYTIRDITTTLKLLGNVSYLFLTKPSTRDATVQILQRLIQMTSLSLERRLYDNDERSAQLLSELFCTITAFVPFLEELYSLHRQKQLPPEVETAFLSLLSAVVGLLGGFFQSSLAASSFDAFPSFTTAVNLLYALSTLRIPMFYADAHVAPLFALAPRVTKRTVQERFYVALTNVLVLPYLPGANVHQKFEERQKLFEEVLMAPLINTFTKQTETTTTTGEEKIQLLNVFSQIAECVRSQPLHSQEIVFKSLHVPFSLTVQLLEKFLMQLSVLETILKFLNVMFDVFGRIAPDNLVENVFSSLLKLLDGNNLPVILETGHEQGTAIVVTFFNLLRLLIVHPRKRHLIQKMVELLRTSKIVPVIVTTANTPEEVLISMSSFIHQLLLEKSTIDPTSVTYLLSILLKNFSRPDANSFKHTLKIFDDLMEKTSIRNGPYFKEFVMNLLEILFKELLEKGHDMIRDDIINTVYNTVKFDLGNFNQFLRQFVEVDGNLSTQQKSLLLALFVGVSDFPTFSQKMTQFVSDCTIFRVLQCATRLHQLS